MCYYIIGGDNLDIGKIIKERRTELNLGVDYVAEKIGKSRATLYRYENGDIEKMPVSILKPLADVLKTTPAELMGFTDNIKLNNIEQKLIKDFRGLNEQGQDYITQTMDMAKGKYTKLYNGQSDDDYITTVAARGNSKLSVKLDKKAVLDDLEKPMSFDD